jgi:hypothetical protein
MRDPDGEARSTVGASERSETRVIGEHRTSADEAELLQMMSLDRYRTQAVVGSSR